MTGWKVRAAIGATAIALVAAIPSVGAGAAAAAPSLKRSLWPGNAVAGSLLVTTTDGRVSDLHVQPGQEAEQAARIERRADVRAVEPDFIRKTMAVPSDPAYAQQWAHPLAHAPAAWDITTGSANVTVAVIDTGVNGTHPDLVANLVAQADASTGTVTSVPLGTNNDPCAVGHGTFVAGVIGGVGNNGVGIAGVAWRVGILDIAANDRVRCVGSFSDSAIIAAVQYAIQRHVDVINLSLGGFGDTCPTAYQTIFDDARAAGISVVAAAGNEELDFPGATEVPASCTGVLAIGAVGQTGAHAVYSNANNYVDLVAPGGDSTSGAGKIYSTTVDGTYGEEEGTSFASPYVAGTIALMKSVRPSLTPDEADRILEGTTQNPPATHSPTMGWGLVDVGAAVQAASTGTIPAAKPPPAPFPVGLLVRVNAPTLFTDPIRQAVAVSRLVFGDAQAQHVVLARPDDYADALAGSALGFGAGPVLFTPSTGGLASVTESEIQRVLPAGGRVYLLGGTAAMPAAVADQLTSLGYTVTRLAGVNRFATAKVVAIEVVQRVQELGFARPTKMILATGYQWPDAVTAGSIAAWDGDPVLLTTPDQLPPETADALSTLHPSQLYVVGGTAAVSDAVATQAGTTSGAGLLRLAGVDRDATAIAIARQMRSEFTATYGLDPRVAVAVNLRRSDGYTHVLSASDVIGSQSGVFIPIEGDGGDTIPPVAAAFACELEPAYGVVAGGADVVTDAAKEQLNAMLERRVGC